MSKFSRLSPVCVVADVRCCLTVTKATVIAEELRASGMVAHAFIAGKPNSGTAHEHVSIISLEDRRSGRELRTKAVDATSAMWPSTNPVVVFVFSEEPKWPIQAIAGTAAVFHVWMDPTTALFHRRSTYGENNDGQAIAGKDLTGLILDAVRAACRPERRPAAA